MYKMNMNLARDFLDILLERSNSNTPSTEVRSLTPYLSTNPMK